MSPPASSAQGPIGKQIVLPWSKAIEIAAKSIRVRFWRSMITMSSIVLAIAFLMSIWTSTAITASLAIGPQRSIETAKADIQVVRSTLPGEPAAPSAADLQDTSATEIRRALRWKRNEVREKTKAKKGKSRDEQKKLQDEIDALEQAAQPANRVQFLHDHLARERRRLERMKGAVDGVLQQERTTTGEETPAPKGAEAGTPVKAAVGGSVTDFISQMSPTDTWLAILALLVCLVGIANAMFMTVQERFREIGTMKCLGALDGFIVKLFLLESSALGLIGTLTGILVGMLLSSIRQLMVYGWPTLTYFPGGNIVLAGALSAVIGLILSIAAAIFPAQRAARMEPVEAMRVEE